MYLFTHSLSLCTNNQQLPPPVHAHLHVQLQLYKSGSSYPSNSRSGTESYDARSLRSVARPHTTTDTQRHDLFSSTHGSCCCWLVCFRLVLLFAAGWREHKDSIYRLVFGVIKPTTVITWDVCARVHPSAAVVVSAAEGNRKIFHR